jgi:hypothetical protein
MSFTLFIVVSFTKIVGRMLLVPCRVVKDSSVILKSLDYQNNNSFCGITLLAGEIFFQYAMEVLLFIGSACSIYT